MTQMAPEGCRVWHIININEARRSCHVATLRYLVATHDFLRGAHLPPQF